MLTWMNKQGVRSDLGFEFQFTGRFSAEYRENGKVTKIYVQGARPVTIYQGSIEGLWSDIPDPAMRDAERNRIIQNISDALTFQGLTLDLVIGPEPKY